jgi:hypothetical protein
VHACNTLINRRPRAPHAPQRPRGAFPTCCKFLMPRTKQMESRMLLLPLPLSPVMALNPLSKLESVTRCA